jgi:hypothetical protein
MNILSDGNHMLTKSARVEHDRQILHLMHDFSHSAQGQPFLLEKLYSLGAPISFGQAARSEISILWGTQEIEVH